MGHIRLACHRLGFVAVKAIILPESSGSAVDYNMILHNGPYEAYPGLPPRIIKLPDMYHLTTNYPIVHY